MGTQTWPVPSRPPASPPEARPRASCHSSVSSARSPRTSRPTCASSPPPCSPSRRPPRPTSSACSRTPTCAPSTPSVSPSCLRTSSWPGGSVASVHKKDQSGLLSWEFLDLTTLGTPCGQSVTAPLQRLCSLKFSNPCALTFLSVCHLYTNT